MPAMPRATIVPAQPAAPAHPPRRAARRAASPRAENPVAFTTTAGRQRRSVRGHEGGGSGAFRLAA